MQVKGKPRDLRKKRQTPWIFSFPTVILRQ